MPLKLNILAFLESSLTTLSRSLESTQVCHNAISSSTSSGFESAQITLDGSQSSDPEDTNDDPDTLGVLSYFWEYVSGAPAGVVLPPIANVQKPQFIISDTTNPVAGVYRFKLVVRDSGNKESTAAFVTVTVKPVNAPPDIIELSPDMTVSAGDQVTLNGLGDDPEDGSNVTYNWTSNGIPLITGNSSSLTFTAINDTDQAIVVTFTLQVFDTKGLGSVPRTVKVTINPPSNQQPIAIIKQGNSGTASINKPFDLSGSGSTDPDPGESLTLTYRWTLVSSPPGSTTLFGPGTQNDPVTAIRGNMPGNYVVSLIVTDINGLDSEPAIITITIPNQAPIANQLVVNGFSTIEIFTVTGTDPDGNLPLTFELITDTVDDLEVSFDFSSFPEVRATPLDLPVKGSFQFHVRDSFGKRSVNPATVEVKFN